MKIYNNKKHVVVCVTRPKLQPTNQYSLSFIKLLTPGMTVHSKCNHCNQYRWMQRIYCQLKYLMDDQRLLLLTRMTNDDYWYYHHWPWRWHWTLLWWLHPRTYAPMSFNHPEWFLPIICDFFRIICDINIVTSMMKILICREVVWWIHPFVFFIICLQNLNVPIIGKMDARGNIKCGQSIVFIFQFIVCNPRFRKGGFEKISKRVKG